jgi:hypothetical protein
MEPPPTRGGHFARRTTPPHQRSVNAIVVFRSLCHFSEVDATFSEVRATF